MSNLGRKNRHNPNDDAPDPRLVIPNLRDELNAVFRDLDLAEVDLRPILPASAKIVPSQPNSQVLKVVLEAASDDDIEDFFRKIYSICPRLGNLHKFTQIQVASYFRGVEISNFPDEPMSIARLIRDRLSMLPKRSSLNLSTAEVDLNTELLYATLPTAIVRIKDLVLMNANTLFSDKNHKDLGAMLGRPLDPLYSQEVIEQYLTDLGRSGVLSDYSLRASFYATREEGGTIYTVRDEYNFCGNNKRINYAGDDCYMFEITAEELIRRGEAPNITRS
jgi:hypothetical protein